MQTLRIFFLLFTKKEKYLYSSIIFLLLANVLLDSVSIALLVPFVSVVLGSNSDLMNQNFLFKNFSFLKDFKLNNYIVFIFFLFLIKNVCQFFIIYIQSKFVQNISTRITSDLYRIYFYQPYSFFLQKFTPEILKNIIESKQFPRLVITVGSLIVESLVLIFLIFFLFTIEFKITLMILTLLTIAFVFFSYFTKNKVYSWGVNRQKNDEIFNKNLIENFTGIKEIKILSKEEYFIRNLNSAIVQANKFDKNIDIIQQVPKLIIEIFSITLICVLIFFYSKIYNLTDLIPIIAAYVLVFVRLIPALGRISGSLQKIKYTTPSLKLIEEQFRLYSGNVNLISNKIIESENFESLKIIKLNFMYQNKKVLSDVDVNFFKNKIYGIIGESGSGKSTFVNLVCGLLKPTSGEILWNNKVSIFEDTKGWQKKISYLPQNIFLIDDSLNKNIALGLMDADIDYNRIQSLISICKLENLVNNLPNGADSCIGEKAIRISGGEAQRIGIARALYFNKEIIIFDEFTSALDSKTEDEILEIIKSLNKTIILVSHKKSVIKICEQVFEINKSKFLN